MANEIYELQREYDITRGLPITSLKEEKTAV